VHLTLFPTDLDGFRDDTLAKKWETIRDVRRVVTGALELERAAKNIGSSLEASPLVYVSDKAIFNTLIDVDLAEVCITSNAMVTNDEAPANAFRLADVPGVAVVVEKAVGTKCARSWKILPTVGEDAEYPDVSPRDAQALREWKALAEGDQPVEAPAEPVTSIETQQRLQTQQPVQEPLEATPEPAASENETVAKPVRKVRARKTVAVAKVDDAESAGNSRKVAAARKTAEASTPVEPKAKKAKAGKSKTKKAVSKKPAAKKTVAKKSKSNKAKAKKAAAKKSKAKATKSRKASSAAKKTAKTAAKKKAGKKAGRKSVTARPKKSKKKAR